MDKIIGKVLPDGKVRYIKIYDESDNYNHGTIATILKNFYTKPERLDALLDLGNLYAFNPNPNDNYKNSEDSINCEAAIRDRKQSENKHSAEIANDKSTLANSKNPCYLFEYGHWYEYRRGRWNYVDEGAAANGKVDKDFKDLSIFYIKESSGLEKIYNSFPNWEHMEAHAAMENKIYCVFREAKLVKTIMPN